jgi:hypothetical protein
LQSLDRFPERCGIAAESDELGLQIRELHFGSYPFVWRALFILADDEVHVLHIRRVSMSPARREDLQD